MSAARERAAAMAIEAQQTQRACAEAWRCVPRSGHMPVPQAHAVPTT
jgi:hypothetical protein